MVSAQQSAGLSSLIWATAGAKGQLPQVCVRVVCVFVSCLCVSIFCLCLCLSLCVSACAGVALCLSLCSGVCVFMCLPVLFVVYTEAKMFRKEERLDKPQIAVMRVLTPNLRLPVWWVYISQQQEKDAHPSTVVQPTCDSGRLE